MLAESQGENDAAPAREYTRFELEEMRSERALLLWAPPVALALAFIMLQSDTWRWLARTFLTMWIHELGHAVAAWLSGRFAVPGPWVTRIGDGTSAATILLVAAGIGYLGYRGWREQRRWLMGLAACLAIVQVVCTLLLSRAKADAFITFFGDGGMLVLGAGLILTFWSPPGSYLHRQWLRWGFLVIGAFAFADATLSWLAAHKDSSTIPYGEIAGVGHSDPTKLVFDRNWTQDSMIARYLWLAAASFVAVAGRYAVAALRPPPEPAPLVDD